MGPGIPASFVHQNAIPAPAPRCAAPPMWKSNSTSQPLESLAGEVVQIHPNLCGAAGVSDR